MRQALEIFKKDVRRMRWAIVLMLALLAVLAREDSIRGDYMNGPLEGWLNLFLPLVWSWVIALAVHQEPVHGDRQFWITRPYRWGSLAAAKGLFAMAFILLPGLIADMYILSQRHFQPFAHLPELLEKQLLVVVAVVVPSMALAAVTRNMVQFSGALAVVVTAIFLVLNAVEQTAPAEQTRRILALWIVTPAALVMIVLQYFRRATRISRIIGSLAVLLAASMFMFLSRPAIFAIQQRLHPAPPGPPIQIRLGERGAGPQLYEWSTRMVRLVIPLSHSLPQEGEVREVRLFDLEIVAANGQGWKLPSSPPALESPRNRRFGGIGAPGDGSLRQLLMLDPSDFDRFRGQRVTIKGRAGASIVRTKDLGSLPISVDSQPLPGLGRCSTRAEDSPWESSFKVICESTTVIPRGVSTTVVHPSGREWRGGLGLASRVFGYPRGTWLSPLDRQQAYYRMIDHDPSGQPGQQWLLPRSMLDGASVRVRPVETLGYTYLNFELRDVDLEQFLVPRR